MVRLYSFCMKMVEVFKTNVAEAEHANQLVLLLQQQYPGGRITFDLEDCDRVLRVENTHVAADSVISLLQTHNYECSIL